MGDDLETNNLYATHHTGIGEYHTWSVKNPKEEKAIGKFIYNEEKGKFVFLPLLQMLRDESIHELVPIELYELQELHEISKLLENKY